MADDLEDGLAYSVDDQELEADLVDLSADVEVAEDSPEPVFDRRAQLKEKLKRKNKKSKPARSKGDANVPSNPYSVSNYMSGIVRAKNKHLSLIELDDLVPKEDQISDTSTFDAPRTDANFAAFMNKHLSTFFIDDRLVVVLSISALRACDVNRLFVRTLKGGSVKLIKKNKLEYDQKVLANRKGHVACTTTNRLFKLIEQGTLSANRVAAIVVDASHQNAKMQRVLDDETFIQQLKRLCDLESKPKVYIY